MLYMLYVVNKIGNYKLKINFDLFSSMTMHCLFNIKSVLYMPGTAGREVERIHNDLSVGSIYGHLIVVAELQPARCHPPPEHATPQALCLGIQAHRHRNKLPNKIKLLKK